MERFLAVYAHEEEAMDIEPVVLPVTYSSREAFLNDLMMAARDTKAAHEAWQRAVSPYQQAMLENIARRFNQEPVIPTEEIERLRPPGPEVTGAFTFCGHDFHWRDFFWEDGGCYKEDLPRLYASTNILRTLDLSRRNRQAAQTVGGLAGRPFAFSSW